MDSRKFDDLAIAVSEETSRRTVLQRVAGGGLAALLTAIGLRGAEAQDVDAQGGRRRRRRRRRQRTRNNINNGTTINTGDVNLVQNGFPVLNLLGAPVVCDGTAATAVFCASGFCSVATNNCEGCPTSRICGENDDNPGLVCCVDGFICADLGCVVATI